MIYTTKEQILITINITHSMKANLILLLIFTPLFSFSQRPIAKDHGKFFETNGNKMLYGGKMNHEHFNINNLELLEFVL